MLYLLWLFTASLYFLTAAEKGTVCIDQYVCTNTYMFVYVYVYLNKKYKMHRFTTWKNNSKTSAMYLQPIQLVSMRIHNVPRPTSVCHNTTYGFNFTWKQRTHTTFHEENRDQTDELNHKKLEIYIAWLLLKWNVPKKLGKRAVGTGIPALKQQKQPPAAEPSSMSSTVWGALSPCPGCHPLSTCQWVRVTEAQNHFGWERPSH